MGYTIQIRHEGELNIPPDAGYVPPNPEWPNYIKLRGRDVGVLLRLMIAVGVVDESIDSGKKRKECRPGAVPAYKFFSNDGYVVSALEAKLISEAMDRPDICTPEFVKRHFPKVDTTKAHIMNYVQQVVRLWVTYNRVAAVNDGYTIK